MRCGITGSIETWAGRMRVHWRTTSQPLKTWGIAKIQRWKNSYIRVLPTVKQCLWAFVPLNMFCLFPSLKLHSDACNWVHWQAAYASVIQWRECDLERSRFIKMFFNGCRNGKFISNDFYIAWFSYLWLRTISGQLQDVSKMTVRQVPGRAHKLSGEFFVGQRLIWPRCCRDQSNYFWTAWSLGIHETPRTPRTPRSQEFEDTQMSRINESRQTLVSVQARRCCSGRAQRHVSCSPPLAMAGSPREQGASWGKFARFLTVKYCIWIYFTCK